MNELRSFRLEEKKMVAPDSAVLRFALPPGLDFLGRVGVGVGVVVGVVAWIFGVELGLGLGLESWLGMALRLGRGRGRGRDANNTKSTIGDFSTIINAHNEAERNSACEHS